MVQQMLGTKHVHGIKDVVEEWQKKLQLCYEILDEWCTCQREWIYLENIFSADDIQKQLPILTSKFNNVDKFWREIMMKTKKKPIVIE